MYSGPIKAAQRSLWWLCLSLIILNENLDSCQYHQLRFQFSKSVYLEWVSEAAFCALDKNIAAHINFTLLHILKKIEPITDKRYGRNFWNWNISITCLFPHAISHPTSVTPLTWLPSCRAWGHVDLKCKLQIQWFWMLLKFVLAIFFYFFYKIFRSDKR